MSALISNCKHYRYWLKRSGELFATKPPAFFVMLNPSTADAETDDHTIRRCLGFAKAWGCNGIVVANLYAYRSTSPKILWSVNNPVGQYNDYWLRTLAYMHNEIICAWGANAKADRVKEFCLMMEKRDAKLLCLGTTKSGALRHPLYVSTHQTLAPWDYNKWVA